MHGQASEDAAIDGIGGIGRHGPHDVARIDDLEGYGQALLLEMIFDFAGKQAAEIAKHRITRGIEATGFGNQMLPRAFGGHDDRMATGSQALFQDIQHAARTGQREVFLGHERHVDVLEPHAGFGGDKPALPPHELDQPDAVGRAQGLDMYGSEAAQSWEGCAAQWMTILMSLP